MHLRPSAALGLSPAFGRRMAPEGSFLLILGGSQLGPGLGQAFWPAWSLYLLGDKTTSIASLVLSKQLLIVECRIQLPSVEAC